jgi:hypothetical protein
VDAAAYYTRSWDSNQFGLRDAKMTEELLTFARPQGTQFWQFTQDYAQARLRDGKVEPTARFWPMKQFTDLTPHASDALGATSDQKRVHFTAFRKGDSYALHILDLGAARAAELEGLPDIGWDVVETTEAAQYQQKPGLRSSGSTGDLDLPARSLVTLSANPAAVLGN